MQEFDRVFDGDDVFGARRVDAIDHRRQRGRFTGTGDACYQAKPAGFIANFLDNLRKEQFVDRLDLGGNDAEHQSDVAALLEHVHTEAAQSGDAIRHVEFGIFLELLFLAVGHHAERHVQHVLGGHAGLICQRDEVAIHANVRIVTNLQVKVGRFALHRDAQQIINVHRHG